MKRYLQAAGSGGLSLVELIATIAIGGLFLATSMQLLLLLSARLQSSMELQSLREEGVMIMVDLVDNLSSSALVDSVDTGEMSLLRLVGWDRTVIYQRQNKVDSSPWLRIKVEACGSEHEGLFAGADWNIRLQPGDKGYFVEVSHSGGLAILDWVPHHSVNY